jgi:hypothetical protein
MEHSPLAEADHCPKSSHRICISTCRTGERYFSGTPFVAEAADASRDAVRKALSSSWGFDKADSPAAAARRRFDKERESDVLGRRGPLLQKDARRPLPGMTGRPIAPWFSGRRIYPPFFR